jgi:hypothetical protein
MHDNQLTMLSLVPILSVIGGHILIAPRVLTKPQLGAFAVGLIDGDGSLQVNHWRSKILQFRLVVKLADKPYNSNILKLLAKTYGGNIAFIATSAGNKYVQWVVNDTKVIRDSIVPLLTQFPPLTSRVRLQLAFVIRCLEGISMDDYFAARDLKYATRLTLPLPFILPALPTYFAAWLGGFIEAEGSFAARIRGDVFTFSIAQLNDLYLLEAIRFFFGMDHLKILTRTSPNGSLYELSIASRKGMISVINHCSGFLQGYKYVQLAEFIVKYRNNAELIKIFWRL